MPVSEANILTALIDGAYVDASDVKAAQAKAKKSKKTVLAMLKESGEVSADLIGQALAESFKLTYADINSNMPGADLRALVPAASAKKHRLIAYKETDKEIVFATDTPKNASLKTLTKSLAKKKKAIVAYGLTEDIDKVLNQYRQTLNTRFQKILEKEKHVAPTIIDAIFEDALVHKSSDIHFEPHEDEAIVRFRVDGVLQEAGRIPTVNYQHMVNLIKVMAHLRIDEHFATQDGAIRFKNERVHIDMRVSIAPVISGEKIVIRLLSSYIEGFGLGDLGLDDHDQELLMAASKKPFGMVLVVGPTGSGKSTTLYSLLRILNNPDVNITTIEDPVEYRISGLNQIQVNEEKGITFSKGLRSIVRQDPDVILVGEIRDTETVEIAVNAALTGHLLFSTFHANDAATAIPRLLDMGAEPFLLASTLELIMAQRLVRKICESCRTSIPAAQAVKQIPANVKPLLGKKKITLYHGTGCGNCGGTGYKGRVAIFEFISMTSAMRELVMTNPSAQEIWALAMKEGAHTLFEDGLSKVTQGVTTLQELMRIATPPVKPVRTKSKKKKS